MTRKRVAKGGTAARLPRAIVWTERALSDLEDIGDYIARDGTGPHRDGWGIAMCQDGDAFVIREPDAASGSMWVR